MFWKDPRRIWVLEDERGSREGRLLKHHVSRAMSPRLLKGTHSKFIPIRHSAEHTAEELVPELPPTDLAPWTGKRGLPDYMTLHSDATATLLPGGSEIG